MACQVMGDTGWLQARSNCPIPHSVNDNYFSFQRQL